MADVSIAAYLTIILTLLFVACVLIVLYYAEPGFPWHSYITLTCAAYAAFGILLLVPIDIAAIIYDRRATVSGSYYYDIDTLGVFYDTFFTMVLIFGSVVLVFEEYYNTDGKVSFTFSDMMHSLSDSYDLLCARILYAGWPHPFLFETHVFGKSATGGGGSYNFGNLVGTTRCLEQRFRP